MAADLFKAYSQAKARPKRDLSIIPAATYVQSGGSAPGKQMSSASIISALANKPSKSSVPKVKLP